MGARPVRESKLSFWGKVCNDIRLSASEKSKKRIRRYMLQQKLKSAVASLVGKTLQSLNFACEMMMFDFENLCIHSQCFTRILLNDSIAFATLDYQNWDGVTDTNNDLWYNSAQYKSKLLGSKICKIDLSATNDLFIGLENNAMIQMYVSNGTPHFDTENEQWRIFVKGETQKPHIVVYSKHIEEQ